MCNQGRHRTGVVVGVLRKLQRWNLVSILEESVPPRRRLLNPFADPAHPAYFSHSNRYRRYAGPKVRVNNEQFIELFGVEMIRVPPPPPPETLEAP